MAETDIVERLFADELVRGLRDLALHRHSDFTIGDEAADHIEQQAAEIERLRAEVDALKDPWRPVDDEAKTPGSIWWLSNGFSTRLGFWGGDDRLWVDLVKAENFVVPEGLHFEPTLYMPFPTPAPHKGE